MLVNLPEKIASAKLFMDEWHKKTKDEKDSDRKTDEQKDIWHTNYEFSRPHNFVNNNCLVRVFGKYDNVYFDDRHDASYGFRESFIPKMVQFHHFITSLFVTNSIIFPAHGLEPHGCRKEQEKYLKIVSKVLKSEIKQKSC
jgi:hypothetical protein